MSWMKPTVLLGPLALLLAGLALVSCADAGAGGGAEPAVPSPAVSADAGGPYAALHTDPAITFDASQTSDPDGEIATYEWDFGDGSPEQEGTIVEHSYAQVIGEYTVTLTVKDAAGAVLDSDTTSARIRQRPNASFIVETAAEDIEIGREIAFDASASDDGDDLGIIAHYRWDFDYDGIFSAARSSSGPSITHSYIRPGEYSVALVVADDDGFESEVETVSIVVIDLGGAIIIIE